MLEPITLEKLKEYGFDDLMIERLSTWSDYECKLSTGKGYFVASNIDGFIYSGELGYDKFHNVGIDRFKTFEEMFDRAYQMKSIVLDISPERPESVKAIFYKIQRNLYSMNFNGWLQKFKGLEYGNEQQYSSFLTKDIWLEFLQFRNDKITEQQQRHEADKASWQIGKPNIYETIQNTPGMKLLRVIESDSFQYFDQDRANCLEDWQYVERAALEFEDRYELDKEAYVKTFFDPIHIHSVEFDEKLLVERLIKNLEPAKHPVFIGYRNYLQKRLIEFKNTSLSVDRVSDIILPQSQRIKERIAIYGFAEFLREHKKLSPNSISKVENLLCTEEMPYCIAILHCLGYLDYFKKEYCNGKAKLRDKTLAEIFEAVERRIKGNVNILNPHSNEDRANYTSHQYIEKANMLIKSLSKVL